MTSREKKAYIEMKPAAYYSGFGGIEIKSIEYGIEDYIVFVAGAWCSDKTVHKEIVEYDENGNSFFKYKRNHIPLDECIRC